jgi:hypothetical protein
MSALAEKYNKMVQANTGPEFLSQHLLERSEDSLRSSKAVVKQ